MKVSENTLPRIDFITFILSISSAAFMGLGLSAEEDEANPPSGSKINLELARQNIDLLELLSEKTKGNRTPEEDRLLEQLLFETRLRFVDVKRKQESSSEN